MTAHDGGPAAIETEHLGKRFDDRWVVEDLTMRVPTGSILGLIGPSGCGKTTTVRLLNGVYRPDAGDVWVGGRRPTDLRTADRQDLGYLPQQPALFPALTLWENLQLHASLNGVRYRRRPRLREVLDLVDLYPDRRTLVREASGGMQRRLALAATLVHDPSTVLLDEPTAGIDPILRARLWEHLRSLAGSGHTVVVTTQYVGEAAHCDLVGLLTDGRLLHLDAPDGLRRAAEGGDRVRVVADGPIAEQVLADIGALDGVQDRVEQPEPSVVVAVVDDAATTDAVVACLTEAGLEVVDVDTQVVDWDEVFVRLVERAPDRAERATADGG